MKILITGGGTGGHVYPALSIIRHLSPLVEADRREANGRRSSELNQHPPALSPAAEHHPPPPSAIVASSDPCLLYIGNSRGLERTLVPSTAMRAFFFPMSAPSSAHGLILVTLAAVRSLAVLLRTRPAVTFATGGYVSVPAVVASWLLRVPVVLFLPDVVPGKAVTWLAPLARQIALSAEASAFRFPANKTEVTGYPVRDAFRSVQRVASRRHFGIPEKESVLCVFGGSQGSRSINQALAAYLPDILAHSQVLHICGEARHAEAWAAAAQLTPTQRERYHLQPFLHEAEMAMALAASDLVLCRSGASTLGELPALGMPAILVPLPASGVHQRENAQYLMDRGAAVILEDDDLAENLGRTVLDLLTSPERLTSMATASHSLDRPDAARRIAAIVVREAA